MIKTQLQFPDYLYHELKRVAAEKEWSFAEAVRRGAEYIVSVNPPGRMPMKDWKLPDPVDLGTRHFSPEQIKELAQMSSAEEAITTKHASIR